MAFRERLPAIFFLALIFLMNFSARFIWGPLLGEIENDLAINHATSGSLFLFITVGYFWGMLFSGYVSHRLNHCVTISLSCVVCGLFMCAASIIQQVFYLQVLLVLLGSFAGLHLPSAIASVIDNLPPKDFGKAFAIHELGPGIGFVVCPLVSQVMIDMGSWRLALRVIGLGMIAVGMHHGIRGRSVSGYGQAPTIKNIGILLAKPVFWVMLILFTLILGAAVGVYAMLPLYLQVERGMTSSYSNYLISISRFTAIAAPFITGWMCSRYGNRPVTAFLIASTGMATILMSVFPNEWVCIPLILQPLLAAGFFVPGYAILAAIVQPDYRNLVVALITPLAMVLGGGATPTIIGMFGDAGMFNAGFISLGLLVTASTLLLFFVAIPES